MDGLSAAIIPESVRSVHNTLLAEQHGASSRHFVPREGAVLGRLCRLYRQISRMRLAAEGLRSPAKGHP
jgi:hypothetical protein